jgi:5-methylcytosine-specific restriction endonuclease McrA
VALTRRCLDCGCRTKRSRCDECQRRREHARNHAPRQQARLAISTRQRERVYRRDGYRCVNCGKADDLTLDHVIPLAAKIKTTYRDDEFATLCRWCNSSKGLRSAR